MPPAGAAIEPLYTLHRFGPPVNRIAKEAGDAFVKHLRHRAAFPRDDRRPTCHRLNHYKTKRLWPVDRKQ